MEGWRCFFIPKQKGAQQKLRPEKRLSIAATQLKTFRGNAIVENAFLPKAKTIPTVVFII